MTARHRTQKVVGYTRVSTDEQSRSGLGLKAQQSLIREECERRGWDLLRVYEDGGASGSSLNGPCSTSPDSWRRLGERAGH